MASPQTGFLSGSWDILGMSISKRMLVIGVVAVAALIVFVAVVVYNRSDNEESAFKAVRNRFLSGFKKSHGKTSSGMHSAPAVRSGYITSTDRPQTAEDIAQIALEEDLNAVRGRRIFSDTHLPSNPLSDSLFRVFPEYGRNAITNNPLVRLQTTPSNPGTSIF